MAGRGKTKFTPDGLRAIGAILTEAREAKGCSLAELERAVREFEARLHGVGSEAGEDSAFGVSASTINRYENGFVKRPSLPTIDILLKVLQPVNAHTGKPYTLEEVVALGLGQSMNSG
ncbi:MAG: helix-turn-helix domain-containing protein [Oscillatoria princeps RMCB-10]|nr:helix-turn-helix domain-containing protein [Oscillatoria princeps RMCB-10]